MSISLFTKRLKLIHPLVKYQKRNGYIVLVPEIGEDLPSHNPLLREDGLPEFSNITIEKCIATIGKQSVDVEKKLIELEENILPTISTESKKDLFHGVFNELEEIESQLETTWGMAKCLYFGNSTLMPTKSYESINNRARKARCAKFNSLPLFQLISNLLPTIIDPDSNYTNEQRRLVQKYYLEGKLNGLQLNENNKLILNETLNKLRQEKLKFQEKSDISRKNFIHYINDYGEVRDFPTEVLQSMVQDPLNAGKGPWRITLEKNVYDNFLEHCSNRKLRWNVWQANVRKASGLSDKNLSNSIHLEQIRDYRNVQAKLLGYGTFAEMSMTTKMAGSVENVNKMLNSLIEYAKPAQEKELQKLEEFAQMNGHNGNLEIFDIPFWKRKQLKSMYNYDDELLREYFPLPKVISGLFTMAEQLFKIKIVERHEIQIWHEDVQFFDIFDESNGNNNNKTKPIAGFYLDLYSQDTRKMYTSGLMVGIRNRCRVSTDNCPLAALIFSLPVPLYGKPSLLSFNDVKTLFMKFGHSLQHLLTQVNYTELAGLSNVEWDTAEITGHVMHHLLLQPDTLKSISSHYSNQEPLSYELIISILEKNKHLSGYELSRELYVAALDLELHSKTDFWLDIVKKQWPKYNCLPLDKKDAHPCSMTEIISGPWAAAYFSHIWSRLIAADVYSAFYEAGNNKTNGSIDVESVGQRFRDTYLSVGGSLHASEVFRQFRGRDPSPKALLKTLGLHLSPSVVTAAATTTTTTTATTSTNCDSNEKK